MGLVPPMSSGLSPFQPVFLGLRYTLLTHFCLHTLLAVLFSEPHVYSGPIQRIKDNLSACDYFLKSIQLTIVMLYLLLGHIILRSNNTVSVFSGQFNLAR